MARSHDVGAGGTQAAHPVIAENDPDILNQIKRTVDDVQRRQMQGEIRDQVRQQEDLYPPAYPGPRTSDFLVSQIPGLGEPAMVEPAERPLARTGRLLPIPIELTKNLRKVRDMGLSIERMLELSGIKEHRTVNKLLNGEGRVISNTIQCAEAMLETHFGDLLRK